MCDVVKKLSKSIVSSFSSGETPDYSKEFRSLETTKKNLLLGKLVNNGIPQKDLAACFAVSASAISQRLNKPKVDSTLLANIQRLEGLNNAGFSFESISALLNESGASVSAKDIEAFIKVKRALTLHPKE